MSFADRLQRSIGAQQAAAEQQRHQAWQVAQQPPPGMTTDGRLQPIPERADDPVGHLGGLIDYNRRDLRRLIETHKSHPSHDIIKWILVNHTGRGNLMVGNVGAVAVVGVRAALEAGRDLGSMESLVFRMVNDINLAAILEDVITQYLTVIRRSLSRYAQHPGYDFLAQVMNDYPQMHLRTRLTWPIMPTEGLIVINQLLHEIVDTSTT